METIGGDLREMQRTPLSASHVHALREAGRIATYPAGTFLARPGEPVDRFVYVEDGEIEVVNPYTDERHLPSTLGPTQFMGEISFLNGGAWSLPMRAVRETRVIEVPREAMLTLMSEIPEMSDIIITVFSARRRRQLDDRDGILRLIGEEEDRNVRRIAEFASRNRIPYSSLPLRSPEAEATARSCSIAPGAARGDFRAQRRRDRSHAGQGRAAARPQSRLPRRRDVRRADRGWRARGGRCGGLCGGRRSVRAGRGRHCDRRPGRYLEPYRELHGLPDGHFRCRPGLARRGTGDEVRDALRDAAAGGAPREA